MTDGEALELARNGETLALPEGGPGVCALCGRGLSGLVLREPSHPKRSHRDGVHAACAAPVLARAHAAAGRAPVRHVSGVSCGVCRRSFRYADQVVIVGRAGSSCAVHVRRCVREKARRA